MTATDIINNLYSHFQNYEYKLNNTLVFDWESDFFAQSKSGYFIECEVKISRGDYFKDFKKDKHRLFVDAHNKKDHHVYRMAKYEKGDILDSRFPIFETVCRGKVDTNKELIRRLDWSYGRYSKAPEMWRSKKFIVNDWSDFEVRKYTTQLRAATSSIYIRKMEDIKLPHQFYFACPPGLIKAEELPVYAGLLYADKYIEVIKRAPYLHKRSLDLHRILLKKYYNLWQYKVGYEMRQAIRENYSETK